MNVKNLKKFEKLLEAFAPKAIADFEYSGVIKNTKIKKGEIKKISLTLDLTSDSVKKALENHSDLLIAFHSPDTLKKDLYWHKRIKKIADKKLTLYKAHLRLNFCKNGVHDTLLKICNLSGRSLTFIFEKKYKIKGGVYKINGGFLAKDLLKKLKNLKAPHMRIYNRKNRSYRYRKILISSGSGFKKEFFEQFRPDMLISGEIKHNAIILAKEYGTTLIELTHWASEDRPLEKMAPILTRHLQIPTSYISLPPNLELYK